MMDDLKMVEASDRLALGWEQQAAKDLVTAAGLDGDDVDWAEVFREQIRDGGPVPGAERIEPTAEELACHLVSLREADEDRDLDPRCDWCGRPTSGRYSLCRRCADDVNG